MSKQGYMCKIAYESQLGEAMGGELIYASIPELEAAHTCSDYCGIVKVDVILAEVIKETNWEEI